MDLRQFLACSRLLSIPASFCVSVVILLGGNVFGGLITYPGGIWGNDSLRYEEVIDDAGQTRILADPFGSNDHFMLQFDSWEAFRRWQEGQLPSVLMPNRPVGVDLRFLPYPDPEPTDLAAIARDKGYFNFRRAFSSSYTGSVEHFRMPYGLAWLESISEYARPPLSIFDVSAETVFGLEEKDQKDGARKTRSQIAKLLDPEEQSEELSGAPEPTVLIILVVVLVMIVIAVLRANWQLHR